MEQSTTVIFLTFLSDFTVITELPNLDSSCKIVLLIIMLLVFLKWDFLVSFSSFFSAYLPQEKSGHTVPEEEKKKIIKS